MGRISESAVVVNRESPAGLFPGRTVAVVPSAGISQVKRLWALAKADVPGAVEEFAAGNECAITVLSQGPRYEVGMFLGAHPLELTALGALARGFLREIWTEVEVSCD